MVDDLRGSSVASYLTPPEPIDWIAFEGFAYTHRRDRQEADLEIDDYLEVIERAEIDIDKLKADKVFMFQQGADAPAETWPIYKCLVFECDHRRKRFVLAGGTWFEIDVNFADGIQRTARNLPLATIALPNVRRVADGKLETEPDYNKRVARERRTIALLDRTTARCRNASSGIEPCDLLTETRDFIHVKPKKGGSSSLSHLFAQARMSGEALIADETFRADVRKLLRDMRPSWENRIPSGRPVSSDFQIVLAILGARNRHPAAELPFFSQVNMVRTAEYLMSRGYRVGTLGIPIEHSS